MLKIPLDILHSLKFFAPISDATCEEILAHAEEVTLNESEILFHQDDPSTHLYVVLKGRLLATMTTLEGEYKIIGTIQAGEPVGELGAISGQPRTLSVHAIENSSLLKIATDFFIQLCQKDVLLLVETLRPIIARSQSTIKLLEGSEEFVRQVAIIPANGEVATETFIEKLQEQLCETPNVICISEGSSFKQLVNQPQKTGDKTILYFLKSYETPLAKSCLEKINVIYVVGQGEHAPEFSNFVLEKIKKNTSLFKKRCELILIHPEDVKNPTDTYSWLKGNDFKLHHHVHLNSPEDMRRLLRFFRAKTTTLVFGGGGTKGWVHIGVIKALSEAGIEIDAVGGTSIGSALAACYITQKNYEDITKTLHQFIGVNTIFSLRTLTWPAMSLFSAKHLTENLKKSLNNIQVEDLWLPYYCISCNYSMKSEEVHRQGPLWEKIRASAAVPGLVPPMVINGQLHFDGGLLNNLPVNVMRNMIGTPTKVIAVRLSSDQPNKERYSFPPVLTFKQVIFSKLGLIPKKYKFPHFLDTFVNVLLTGELPREYQNAMDADLLISPDLSAFNMLSSTPEQIDRLIQIGYEETKKALSAWKPSSPSTR